MSQFSEDHSYEKPKVFTDNLDATNPTDDDGAVSTDAHNDVLSPIMPDENDPDEMDDFEPDSVDQPSDVTTVIREQDRFLPIANISRIMKRMVPTTGKIAKDSKECAQECVSEFISFITSEASERCVNEKRKTITGEDILWAMQSLGFENYVEPLKIYLQKYREAHKTDFKSSDTRAVGNTLESDASTSNAELSIAPGISSGGVSTAVVAAVPVSSEIPLASQQQQQQYMFVDASQLDPQMLAQLSALQSGSGGLQPQVLTFQNLNMQQLQQGHHVVVSTADQSL